jgi:serine/threonine protein kinase
MPQGLTLTDYFRSNSWKKDPRLKSKKLKRNASRKIIWKNYKQNLIDLYMKEIFLKIKQLAQLGIAHRDLKDNNIIVWNREPYLIDMGAARWCEYLPPAARNVEQDQIFAKYKSFSPGDAETTYSVGTYAYQSPFVLLFGLRTGGKQSYSPNILTLDEYFSRSKAKLNPRFERYSDLWSLGAIWTKLYRGYLFPLDPDDPYHDYVKGILADYAKRVKPEYQGEIVRLISPKTFFSFVKMYEECKDQKVLEERRFIEDRPLLKSFLRWGTPTSKDNTFSWAFSAPTFPELRAVGNIFEKQPSITMEMRSTLVNWLFHVTCQLQMELQAWFLAINLLDRYISAQPEIQSNKFQLIGCACLFVSGIMFHVNVSTKSLSTISANCFDEMDLSLMVMRIQSKLQNLIITPTLLSIYFKNYADSRKSMRDIDLNYLTLFHIWDADCAIHPLFSTKSGEQILQELLGPDPKLRVHLCHMTF